MKLYDIVEYGERWYFLRGFTSMSVTPERAHLEDLMTGERVAAPLDAVQPIAHEDARKRARAEAILS